MMIGILMVMLLLLQIPDDILNNVSLKPAMKVLPQNYNFEVCAYYATLKATLSCLFL